MNQECQFGLTGQALMVLAGLVAAVALGPRQAHPPQQGAAAGAAQCEALSIFQSGAVVAQVRYESGQILCYRSLDALLAQLRGQEHPGMVRAVHVLDGQGRWRMARLDGGNGRLVILD
ncbi:hypothetical protein ACLB1G_05105 [Oxalobacteraceae bacterium A2-2]